MKLNRKAIVAAAIIASAASFSAPSAFAAGADSFSDVPKDHWAYEALDYLAKEGVVDGYTDGTFEGNRTMSRYEMAAIVYKACQNENISIGGRAVLDKLRAEYDAEIKQLNTRVDKVEKDVEELKKTQIHGFMRVDYSVDQNSQKDGLKRYLLDMNASYRVNDNWTAKTHQEYNTNYTDKGGTGSRINKSDIHRYWVEGVADNGNWVNIGRAWRGLGMQAMLFGNESDGIQAGIKLNSNGLQVSPFYISRNESTSTDIPYTVREKNGSDVEGDNFFSIPGQNVGIAVGKSKANQYNSFYGLSINGPIGHNFDINATVAKSSSDEKAHNGTAWGLAASTNVAKNLKFIGDYVRVGNDANANGVSWGLRLNYKDTDLNDKGSFGMYLRYVKTGQIFGIGDQGDNEWGTYEKGARTWILGTKYVVAKNIEWQTMFGHASNSYKPEQRTRNFFRTFVDFHF